MPQVLCGDAISVLKGMIEENSIDTVYTTPSPFGYYNPSETGMIGAEKSVMEYVTDLVNICNECSRVLKPTGNMFIQLGDQYDKNGYLYGIPTLFELKMREEGFALNDRLIWHRTEKHYKQIEDKGFLKNYEFIFHFIHKDFYFNTKSKYCKSSVLSYPLEDSYYTNEFDSGLPYKLAEIIIDTSCPPNGVILDPLCGSAKVGVVAKKMNRDFIGIDINREIVELCKIRLGLPIV